MIVRITENTGGCLFFDEYLISALLFLFYKICVRFVAFSMHSLLQNLVNVGLTTIQISSYHMLAE